jgi:hypothetical protein
MKKSIIFLLLLIPIFYSCNNTWTCRALLREEMIYIPTEDITLLTYTNGTDTFSCEPMLEIIPEHELPKKFDVGCAPEGSFSILKDTIYIFTLYVSYHQSSDEYYFNVYTNGALGHYETKGYMPEIQNNFIVDGKEYDNVICSALYSSYFENENDIYECYLAENYGLIQYTLKNEEVWYLVNEDKK